MCLLRDVNEPWATTRSSIKTFNPAAWLTFQTPLGINDLPTFVSARKAEPTHDRVRSRVYQCIASQPADVGHVSRYQTVPVAVSGR